MFDPYTILGAEAYLAKAKAHHPDTGGDAEVMQAINDAYAILSDPEKRRAWDSGTYQASGPPPIEARAVSLLLEAFQVLLHQKSFDPELTHCDLISELKELILEARSTLKDHMQARKRELRKHKMLLRRLRFQGSGSNPLVGYLSQLIASDILWLKHQASERAAMKLALELCDSYNFEFEPAPPQTPWEWGSSTVNPNDPRFQWKNIIFTVSP